MVKSMVKSTYNWKNLLKSTYNWKNPSGYVKIAIENDHIYSGFSHEKLLNPVRYVKLPEGNWKNRWWGW